MSLSLIHLSLSQTCLSVTASLSLPDMSLRYSLTTLLTPTIKQVSLSQTSLSLPRHVSLILLCVAALVQELQHTSSRCNTHSFSYSLACLLTPTIKHVSLSHAHVSLSLLTPTVKYLSLSLSRLSLDTNVQTCLSLSIITLSLQHVSRNCNSPRIYRAANMQSKP